MWPGAPPPWICHWIHPLLTHNPWTANPACASHCLVNHYLVLYFVITLFTLCYEPRRPEAAIPLDALTLHSEVVLTRLTELCWNLQKKVLEGERNDLQAMIEAELEEVMNDNLLATTPPKEEAGKQSSINFLFLLFCKFALLGLWGLCSQNTSNCILHLSCFAHVLLFHWSVMSLNGYHV